MVDRNQFERIRKRHGGYASWAVWAPPGDKPKSNVGDLSVLNPDGNPTLLQRLRTDIIMVGLNIARPLAEPFCNFHDSKPRANDFKLRHALAGTEYWGAYMTDFIKNVPIVTSSDLRKHLKAFPDKIKSSVDEFLDELRDLKASRPMVIALGNDAHRLIVRNLPADVYGRLVRVTHYSYRVGKEKYRDTVLAQLTER